MKEHEFLFIRDEVVPIISISKLLKFDYESTHKKYIVLKSGASKFAVEISEIISMEDVLVKPLPKIIRRHETAACR